MKGLIPMKIHAATLPIIVGLALVLCANANADTAMVGIYRNTLETLSQRTEVLKVKGRSCTRAGSDGGLMFMVRRRTEECVYRSPVLGRNLEVAAAGRLLPGTPKAVSRKAFLGLVLRAGGGTRYELRVFPAQKKTQLLKFREGGGVQYLAIEKRVVAVKGIGEPQVLRLRAEGDGSRTKLTAHLGSETVGEVVDDGPRIDGEYTAVSLGAPGNGHRVQGMFGGIVVRVPVRF